MAKAEKEKINKSEIIRQAIKDAKWDGDNLGLSKYLEEQYPGEKFPATAIGSIRSKSKSDGNPTPAAKPAKVSFINPNAFPPVPKSESQEREAQFEFLRRLAQMKELIGSEGVKKLVDGL